MIPLSIIEQYARSTADRPAVIAGQQAITWREYQTRVHSVADRLAEELRDAPEPRAVLLGAHSIDYVVTPSALATLGIAWIGLDPQAEPERLPEQLGQVSPRLVVAQDTTGLAGAAPVVTFRS